MGSDKTIDLGGLSYEDALFFLKIVSNQLFGILNAVFSGSINVTDQALNERYIYLKGLFESILNRKDLEALSQKRVRDLPDHIFNDIEATHVWWTEEGEIKFMSFLGEVEIFFIKNGQHVPALIPSGIIDFFNKTEADIIKHKENKAGIWEKIESKTPEVQPHPSLKKIHLGDFQIAFDDEIAQLIVGDFKRVDFPPHKNQHYLLRKIFSKRKNEAADWEELYEEMTKTRANTNYDQKESKAQKKSVSDTVLAINKRVQEILNTDCVLLHWEIKCVKRLY